MHLFIYINKAKLLCCQWSTQGDFAFDYNYFFASINTFFVIEDWRCGKRYRPFITGVGFQPETIHNQTSEFWMSFCQLCLNQTECIYKNNKSTFLTTFLPNIQRQLMFSQDSVKHQNFLCNVNNLWEPKIRSGTVYFQRSNPFLLDGMA